jgi:tRNA (guanine37-N1)-methyltransferase
MGVPEALMSGYHEEIRKWRRQQALRKTLRNRPDLLQGAALSKEDEKFVAGFKLAEQNARNRG